MILRTYIAVAAAAGVAAAFIATSTIAVARGGGSHGAVIGEQPLTPPPPTPQFNSPGAQTAPSRAGNPANQRTPMSLIPPQGWEPSTSGRGRSLTGKKNRSDVAVSQGDQQLDKLLRTGICRGC